MELSRNGVTTPWTLKQNANDDQIIACWKKQRTLTMADFSEENRDDFAEEHGGGLDPQRVVIHIDLDCFYCQVEQKRLEIPREIPCAVQQWRGLIAVNYAARDAGVTRGMTASVAKLKCPMLRLVHVETIGEGGDRDAGDHESNARRQSTQKACLERYREASLEIMGIFRRLAPTAIFEKASIDEVYLDVSESVTSTLEKEAAESDLMDRLEHGAAISHVIGGPMDLSSEAEKRLATGAMIALELRTAVHKELEFTCSAGVANNKQLAKLVSAMNKPNKQTVVVARGVHTFMQDIQLKKIRFFGGKVSERLEEMGCKTAGDVEKMSFAALIQAFGKEKARWISNCVRGLDEDEVRPKSLPKSMLAAKSFAATSDMRAIERWIGILSEELATRMRKDEEMYSRKPRNLVLYYRVDENSAGRSRCCAMPAFGQEGPQASALARSGMNIFRQLGKECLPCGRLALGAGDFVDAPVAEKHSIARFLTGMKRKNPDGEETNPDCAAQPTESPSQIKPKQPHSQPSRTSPSMRKPSTTLMECWSKKKRADSDVGVDLSTIDVGEQLRIFQELERGGGSGAGDRSPSGVVRGRTVAPKKAKRNGDKGQLSISAMFAMKNRK
ncbi:hypothetical protein BSKO_00363 [Bryopsis sp. KO-2023]|nr:hypothetical protein BSKO_00363 [Bryopsis sp. KO-2023]